MGQRSNRSPAGIDLNLPRAGGTVEFHLVAAFDTQLANMIGAFVIGGQPTGFDLFHFRIVDTTDIADGV